MSHRSGEHNSAPYLDFLSGGFIQAMWETLIALIMAGAICISLISLSVHLNKAKTLREGLPSVANIGAPEAAPHFN
jgi:hypothetical protein